MTLLGLADEAMVPAWLTLPMAGLAVLLIATHMGLMTRAEMPESRRRIRTVTGWMMEQVGPSGFFVFIGVLYTALTAYALYRMTRRAAPTVSGAFRGVTLGASPLAVEAVLEEAAKDDPLPEKTA